MKKICVILICSFMCVLMACSKRAEEKGTVTEETEVKEMQEKETEEKGTEESETERQEEMADAKTEAFVAVLEGIYYEHVLPENQALDFDDTLYDISENKFAVYDVDLDGKEELIVEFTTSSMAGMAEIIYDYDDAQKTVREELLEFPALTFYDNGMIKAEWSHNQGFAGDFWPYTLYQYDAEMDSYQAVGTVDAWDRSLSEKDYEGNPFPEEVDKDGDGIVYYLGTYGETQTDAPVDGAEYEAWRRSFLGNAQSAEPAFLDLTEENINQLK